MSRQVKTVNPATEEVIASYDFMTKATVEEVISTSADAFGHWRKVQPSVRLECVRVFAESLQAGRVTLGEMITKEMGKPIRESLAELDKCIASCHSLREHFPEWREQLKHSMPSGYSVSYEPLGPVLGIMPWNFPLWQVVRFAVPALLCGNTVLLKHAPNTWGTGELIADLFRQALPDGVYTDLRVDVPDLGPMIADRRVRAVSLTGSRRAGSSVAEIAGKHLKKCVLELGGSDAYVVLEDADVEKAADICAKSRMMNAGQSCVSAKRFIVAKSLAEPFTELMVQRMSQAQQGDPSKPSTDVGPLARADLRSQLADQVKKSLKQGVVNRLGGELPKSKGYFYPPTVLTEVRPGMTAFDEELFGPVAAVTTFNTEEEAFQLANSSRYGLGGAVFSKDTERAYKLARTEMDSGMVFVNDFVRSDALAPFGGVKDSGLGRELGREGCFEFTNIKTLFLAPK